MCPLSAPQLLCGTTREWVSQSSIVSTMYCPYLELSLFRILLYACLADDVIVLNIDFILNIDYTSVHSAIQAWLT